MSKRKRESETIRWSTCLEPGPQCTQMMRHTGGKQRKLGGSSFHTESGNNTAGAGEDSTKSQLYVYEPLAEDTIRVLHLEPGRFGTPLIGRLEQVSMDDGGLQYEAISYVWGPIILPHELHVPEAGTVRITESLFEALQHIRLEHNLRTLWADAICIDQRNDRERSGQVLIMDCIFLHASKVLAWLGCSQPEDDIAFATLDICADFSLSWDALSDLTSSRTASDWVNKSPVLMQRRDRCRLRDSDIAYEGVRAAFNLLSKPYFKRLWVLQEFHAGFMVHTVLLSGTNAVGACSLRTCVTLFCAFAEHYERQADLWDLRETVTIFFGLDSEGFADPAIAPFATGHFIAECFSLSYANPRDRVFALYGILEMRRLPGIVPDYTLSTLQVYQNFFAASIEEAWTSGDESGLRLFMSFAGTESAREDSSWPSWLPDFHHLTQRSLTKTQHDLYAQAPTMGVSDASDIPRFHLRNGPTASLSWQGVVHGTVTDILATSNWPKLGATMEKSQIAELLTWYRRCRAFAADALASPTADSDVMRLLCCDYPSEMYDIKDSLVGRLEKEFAYIWDSDCAGSGESFLFCCTHQFVNPIDYDRILAKVELNGAVHVGWVPKPTKTGDRLAALKHLPLPFLVRPRGDGTYRLLGDTWFSHLPLEAFVGVGTRTYEKANAMHGSDWGIIDERLQCGIDDLDWVHLT